MSNATARKVKVTDNSDKETTGKHEIQIKSGGVDIVIPEGLTIEEACRHLRSKEDEQNTIVSISEVVKAFPLDGAAALNAVIERRYGWANLKTKPGSFFTPPAPPSMVGVQIGPNETIQVPWGQFTVPNIDGWLETSYTINNNGPFTFRISGQVRRKDEAAVADLAEEVRREVKENSIYAGKFININFRDNYGNRFEEFDFDFAPKFTEVDLEEITQIVYSEEVEKLVRTNLTAPVVKTKFCRKNNIPLNRKVLLAGIYGTGKTLTAFEHALTCVKHGWTFLHLKDVRDLDLAFSFAKFYQPCVIFSEDIDRAVRGARTAEIDQILNTIDGVDSKQSEIMILLTTNNLNHIHPAFMRPGRIDTVIEVTPPDKKAIVRLVRQYAEKSNEHLKIEESDEEVMKIFEDMEGANAAFIREAVERAKLSALLNADEGQPLKITGNDLRGAVASLKAHVKLVHPEAGEENSINADSLALRLLAERLMSALVGSIADPKLAGMIKIKKPFDPFDAINKPSEN